MAIRTVPPPHPVFPSIRNYVADGRFSRNNFYVQSYSQADISPLFLPKTDGSMERRCHHLMLCRGGSSALTAPLKHCCCCCCCPEHSEHCKLEIQRTSFVKNTSISGGGYS